MTRILRLVLCLFPACVLGNQAFAEDVNLPLIAGSYHLIGLQVDSNTRHVGEVELIPEGGQWRVVRKINGKETSGSAQAKGVGVDHIPVLDIRFIEDNIAYAETCRVLGSPGEYARLSCHLYYPDKQTHKVGMEGLFFAGEKLPPPSTSAVKDDFVARFSAGNYVLLGHAPGLNRSYSGQITIQYREGQKIQRIIRYIEGRKISGTARVAVMHLGTKDIPLLQMRFKDQQRWYDESCLVDSDLDNYARLSCETHTPGTASAGREVLFIREESGR